MAAKSPYILHHSRIVAIGNLNTVVKLHQMIEGDMAYTKNKRGQCKWARKCLSFHYMVATDSHIYTLNHCEALQWRHNERDGVSNHQPHDCLLNRLFRYRSKKTSKIRVTGHCEGNSSVTGEFRAQRARNAENTSIRWRHHGISAMIWIPYTSFKKFFLRNSR